jgi:iron complex transport system substrate-binding protein
MPPLAAPSPLAVATPASPATRYPLALTDSAGRQVTLNAPPARIVSLSAGYTEALFAIGAGPLVVGTDDFSNYPETVRGLPKVGYSRVDLEKLSIRQGIT